MDKYIKESELFKRILNVDFKHDYDGCIKFCQSIPAADVEEVRYGKWVQDEFGSRCGACGLYSYRDKFDKPWESPYCPNCGAKMDEVSE